VEDVVFSTKSVEAGVTKSSPESSVVSPGTELHVPNPQKTEPLEKNQEPQKEELGLLVVFGTRSFLF